VILSECRDKIFSVLSFNSIVPLHQILELTFFMVGFYLPCLSMQVAQQVHSEVTFRCSTTGTKYHTDGLSEEQLATKETGTFRLPAGCPFKESKVVLWLTQANCSS
jgi:hypothetical protein